MKMKCSLLEDLVSVPLIHSEGKGGVISILPIFSKFWLDCLFNLEGGCWINNVLRLVHLYISGLIVSLTSGGRQDNRTSLNSEKSSMTVSLT